MFRSKLPRYAPQAMSDDIAKSMLVNIESIAAQIYEKAPKNSVSKLYTEEMRLYTNPEPESELLTSGYCLVELILIAATFLDGEPLESHKEAKPELQRIDLRILCESIINSIEFPNSSLEKKDADHDEHKKVCKDLSHEHKKVYDDLKKFELKRTAPTVKIILTDIVKNLTIRSLSKLKVLLNPLTRKYATSPHESPPVIVAPKPRRPGAAGTTS